MKILASREPYAFMRLMLLLVILIFFESCKTAPKVDKYGNPIYSYEIEDNIVFEDVEDPYKYIFLRLYDVEYYNPFYIANVLKFGINFTEVNDLQASHASINFSLEDDFYGLTSGGKYQLAKESCADTKANKFLKKCDPEKTTQITYAIKVSEDEYYKVKKMVEEYAESTEVKYDVTANLRIASFAAKRKFFTRQEDRAFGVLEYPEPDPKTLEPGYVENKFVCCTFIAYVLKKNVEKINKWFTDNKINYEYIVVSDLPLIPGVVKLFTSNCNEYNVAAQEFVKQNPEFEEYYYFDEFEQVIKMDNSNDVEELREAS